MDIKLIERTEHGSNIADQIEEGDAYGHYEDMTPADLWNILDQFHTHVMYTSGDNQLMSMLTKWMRELETIYNIETI